MSSFYFSPRIFISVLLFFFSTGNIFAQSKYWVSFSDKAGVTFNPYEYFSQRTIERRMRYGILLCDSSDFPVSEKYLKQVEALSDSLSWPSRWLNGIAVYTSEENIQRISRLPFVSGVEHLSGVLMIAEEHNENASSGLKPKQMELLKYQTLRMQGNLFSEKKMDGKGILVAVFDTGFPNVNELEEFSHLIKEKRIKATYDFVRRRENVFSYYPHGAMTLSCIAGKYEDTINIGLATGADILLARTEKAKAESFSEEENWLAAVEWADKNGADIISSSLGYSFQRYFNNEMNGKKSLVARAAAMAAAKGILVVNAAGNDGDNRWKFIDTPGDADSVLTVGGTDPYRDIKIDFSSIGPSSDGRLKPEVCAPAEVMVAGSKGMSHSYGTSFSCPLVAGFAACVWQMHRDWNNMELYHKIQESGHLYPYFDYAHGYGIPQASYFILPGEKNTTPTFSFETENYELNVMLNEAFVQNENTPKHRNLYYHISNGDGTLALYSVVDAYEREVLSLNVRDYSIDQELVVHFEGYTGIYRFIDFKR